MPDRPFNTGEPIGYFITWTTYGTWLPGDQRSWRIRGNPDAHPPNKLIETVNRSRMKESEFRMSDEDRNKVEETIRRHCEIRAWTLHAVNARSNHVHVVIATITHTPKQIRDQLKSWCTRKLKPTNANRQRFWTEGASCRWINHAEDLDSAIEYTNDAQDRK